MEITRKSLISGIVRTKDLPITQEQLDRFNAGEYVQRVFPELPKEDREFILSGITKEEWDNTFKEERVYQIHHVVNPTYTEDMNAQKKFVGTVEAISLDSAFIKSQNFSEPWNPENPCRSTSVGDCIVDSSGNMYMVCGVGFKQVK